MRVDFGNTAQDYATHRAGFPDSLFERLRAFGVGKPGQYVLDLGTGTGTLARGFATRGCTVTGIDPSEQMLEQARLMAGREGIQVEFRVARAEETGLAPMSADAATAGQCWHWFDRARAAAECRRVLNPSGALAICHFDWIPTTGNVVAATEALIVEHNPAWAFGGGNGMYPQWARDVADAGFEDIETFSYDVDVPYTHEAWRGRIRASAGVAASLPPDAVDAFDGELALLLAASFAGKPLAVPHRVWALVCRTPPE